MICLLTNDKNCNECDRPMRYAEDPVLDAERGPFCSIDCHDGRLHREAELFVLRIRCSGCDLLGHLDGCMCGEP